MRRGFSPQASGWSGRHPLVEATRRTCVRRAVFDACATVTTAAPSRVQTSLPVAYLLQSIASRERAVRGRATMLSTVAFTFLIVWVVAVAGPFDAGQAAPRPAAGGSDAVAARVPQSSRCGDGTRDRSCRKNPAPRASHPQGSERSGRPHDSAALARSGSPCSCSSAHWAVCRSSASWCGVPSPSKGVMETRWRVASRAARAGLPSAAAPRRHRRGGPGDADDTAARSQSAADCAAHGRWRGERRSNAWCPSTRRSGSSD